MKTTDHAQGLRHAALECTNLEASRKFYIEKLGFRDYYEGDSDWAMLALGDTTLSLVPVEKIQPRGPTGGSHQSHLGLIYDDKTAIDALHAELSKAKVQPLGKCTTHRDGSYGFYVADPDGNALECIWIPHVSHTEDRSSEGWVLLAHGSRSPEWAEPFEEMLESLKKHVPSAHCRLAFMEMCEPTLEQAVAELVDSKVKTLKVFSIFLSGGGAHMTRDVPALVDNVAKKFPTVKFSLSEALGATRLVRESFVAAVVQSAISSEA